MTTLRTCADCKELLPATTEHFSVNRHRKDGLVLWCRPCSAKRWQVHYQRNREVLIAKANKSTRKRRLRPEVREAERIASREAKRRQLADPLEREKHNERGREWRKANPERAKLFKHEQPAMKAYRAMMRYRLVKRATPAWVDLEAIQAVYFDAAQKTAETGIPHEVDHIVPLGGRKVCGLNVPWNLRVIPADENRKKSNHFIEALALA